MKSWWREPLLQFFILGLVIFSVDQFVYPASDEQRIIAVDEKIEDEIISLFKDGQGRTPSSQELGRLTHRWLQNEVLYREALALGLDKGDEMIRDRLILKMRNVVFNNIIVDFASEDELRRWFEANRSSYDLPRRFDFVQFQVAKTETDDHKVAGNLAATMADGVVPADYADLVRIYKNRSRDNIAGMFGDAFATSLVAQSAWNWRALPSDKGWHLVRLKAIHDATPASFETLKTRIKADWRKEQERKAVFYSYKEMRERYDIRNEAQG